MALFNGLMALFTGVIVTFIILPGEGENDTDVVTAVMNMKAAVKRGEAIIDDWGMPSIPPVQGSVIMYPVDTATGNALRSNIECHIAISHTLT